MRGHYKILGTPADRGLNNAQNGLDFLLFSVSNACNHYCHFCWTHGSGLATVKESKILGKGLDVLVQKFAEKGGQTCAIMSDGEPLFRENLVFTKEIIALTGKHELCMLLFTNGEFLDASMIQEIDALNPRISFLVSFNGSSQETYDGIHGKGAYERVIANISSWKSFCQRTNQQTENGTLTRFALHFVATRENIAEISDFQAMAEDLNSAMTVTSPGMTGRAFQNSALIAVTRKEVDKLESFARKHSDADGPTARAEHGECAYISHSRNTSSHGITIDAVTGAVRACPYYQVIGSEAWFSLGKYVAAGGEDIAGWLECAVEIATLTTNAIFASFDYHYCIKRHERYAEIEQFLREINERMRSESIKNPKESSYFRSVITALERVIST